MSLLSARPVSVGRLSATAAFGAAVVFLSGCVSERAAESPSEEGAVVVSECTRPKKPEGLSGITRLPDGRYLAIDDTGGVLCTLEVACDGNGQLKGCKVLGQIVLEGVADGEGVAYDPLRKTVWATDEAKGTLAEYRLTDGKMLSRLALPAYFAKCREYRGLESLAISPDGRTLWTANEEALACDGERSSKMHGTTVRLQRFTRASAADPWHPAGCFAYETDALGGTPYRGMECCGVSDLAVLPDGRLVVLERELSVKSFVPTFRLGLYGVDATGATDISKVPALQGRAYVPVKKEPLLVQGTFISMYEGVAQGPRLANGASTLLFVSDGDGPADEKLLLVRLP